MGSLNNVLVVFGLMLALAQGSQALAASDPEVQWDCHGAGVSDPDYIDATIYIRGEKLIAHVFSLTGDGDYGAYDTIELEAVDSHKKAVNLYVQVEGSKPVLEDEKEKNSRKTRGARIVIDRNDVTESGLSAGYFTAKKSPTGNDVKNMPMLCHEAD